MKSNFSRLKRDILPLLEGKRTVAFDVFDTLIRRCVEPETVKDEAARFLQRQLQQTGKFVDWALLRKQRADLEVKLGIERESSGMDAEFLYENMLRQWISMNVTREHLNRLVNLVAQYEIQLEESCQEPTPDIKDLLNELSKRGIKLCFISDMYFSTATIWEFLRNAGLDTYFSKGYCSSDEGFSKRSGRLYDVFLSREGIVGSETIMVGDNYHSDVVNANSHGILAIHVLDGPERKRRVRIQAAQWAAQQNPYWSGYYLQHLISNGFSRHLDVNSDDAHYRMGATVAPLLVLFTEHIIRRAREEGIEQLLFLAREGKVFYDIYNQLTAGQDDAVPAEYVYVSRKSTFLASMDSLSWNELSRFMAQYPKQSLRTLLNNLSVAPGEYLSLGAQVGIQDPDDIIENPETNEAFKRFLDCPEVKSLFSTHRDNARNLLLRYFEQINVFKQSKVGVVDIGWKGTIQDNLVKAFAAKLQRPFVHGFYFGLLDGHNEWGDHSEKEGFAADYREFDAVRNVVFRNGSLFEMATTPDHGTTVGYRLIEDVVRPELKIFESEKENFRQYFSKVFRAIQDFTTDYEVYRAFTSDVEPRILSVYFLDKLRRYILYPTSTEAKAFLQYSHVESFGVNHVTTYEFKGSVIRQALQRPVKEGPRRISDLIRRQIWPEAAIKRTQIPMMTTLYDVYRTFKG